MPSAAWEELGELAAALAVVLGPSVALLVAHMLKQRDREREAARGATGTLQARLVYWRRRALIAERAERSRKQRHRIRRRLRRSR